MVSFAELQRVAFDIGHDVESEVVQFLNAAEALFESKKLVRPNPVQTGFGQNDPVNPIDGNPPSALPQGFETGSTNSSFGGNDPISPTLATLANTTPAQTGVDVTPAPVVDAPVVDAPVVDAPVVETGTVTDTNT